MIKYIFIFIMCIIFTMWLQETYGATTDTLKTTNTITTKTETLEKGSNLYYRFLIVEHTNSRGDLSRFGVSRKELDPDEMVQDLSISLPVISSATDMATLKGTVKIGTEMWTFVNEAIVNIGDGKLIVDTSIYVQDGNEGQAKYLTKEPYPSVKVAGNQLQRVIEFIDIGITIKVTPKILDDNMVSTKINTIVSEVLRESEEEGLLRVPVVSSRDMSTCVALHINQLEVLSELTVDKKVVLSKGIPFLRNIPLLGKLLFTTSEDSTAKTKLYIVGGFMSDGSHRYDGFDRDYKTNKEEIRKHFPFK